MKEDLRTAADGNELPPTECPGCRKVLNCAAGVRGRRPKPGDPTICTSCGMILVFKEDMLLREAMARELAQLEAIAPREFQVMRAIANGIATGRMKIFIKP